MTETNKKILGFADVALLTFLSNFGVRWFAIAASIGASSIIFWLLGALLFFIPLAFISAQLSKLYPEEGGLYAWTRHSLGERSGFIVAWLYWINGIFYYPAILIFLATNFAYFLNKPELANSGIFVCVVVLIAFWLVVLSSLFGLKANKSITEYCGILGTIIPCVLLIILGFSFFIKTGHSATIFNWRALMPDHHVTSSLANLTMIMFAMAGVEIIPTFANSVKNPKRDLYLGLIIGAIAIVACYIVGTIALNFILSPSEIQNTSGLIDAFKLVATKLHLPWLTQNVAFLLVLAELAAVSIWLIAPIVIFFKCTPKGLLPDWCHQTNRYNAPANAILFVGALVTLIILATNLLPSVNSEYQALVVMTAVLCFIPYLFLVFAYIKKIKLIPGNRLLHYSFAVVIFVSLCFGIIFSFQPPANITGHGAFLYELEVFIGPIIFIALGYAIYYFRKNFATTLQLN